MAKFSVIKSGGKQYLVGENQEVVVDKLPGKAQDTVELETLAVIDGENLDLGTPVLKQATKAQILEHMKGDKIRVAKFKAKVRYRRVNGFRAELTKIKILSI